MPIRAQVAVVLAVGFAVLSSMALGVFGLGGSSFALGLVASVAAGAVLVRVPRQGPALLAWWASLNMTALLVVGGLGGLGIVLVWWYTANPLLGFDGVNYHLAESLHWVAHGNPGAAFEVSVLNPYGSFPLVDEIFNGWLLGVARGFGPVLAWPVVTTALFATGSWTALRNRRVGATPAALATAALVCGPLIVGSLIGPGTDVSSLAWLAVAACLLDASDEHPGLAGPGLLAVGLAIGTKSTVLPYCGVLVLVWLVRRPWSRLMGQRLVVGGLAIAGAIIGGLCYARNLFVHGSPVWPTTIVPWGDARPPGFFGLYATFAGNVSSSLDGNGSAYRDFLAGHLVLLVAAVCVPLLCRRRLPVAFGVATLVGVGLFAIAPTTGIPPGSPAVLAAIHVISIRYLLPATLPAAAAIAFAADASRRWAGRLWRGVLVGAIGWSVHTDLTSPLIYRPDGTLLALGLIGGGGIAVALSPSILRRPVVRGLAHDAVGVAACAALAVAVLGACARFGSADFLERHARTPQPDSHLITSVLRAEPLFGDHPVAMSPTVDALVSGDDLTRPVEFIGPSEPCSSIRDRLAHESIVLTPSFGIEQLAALRQQVFDCLAGIPPSYYVDEYIVYLVTPAEGSPTGR